MSVIRGRYRPTTGRRWFFGGAWLGDKLVGVSWGIAGRGYYVAIVT